MEPITTAVAITAVVHYLAEKLAANKSVGDFFNDFTDATVAWVKPIFLTDEGKEKEVLQDLVADPNEQLNQDAAANAIAKAVKKNPDVEKHLHEMAKVIQEKEPNLGKQNISTIMGDNNKVFQGINNSHITDNSVTQHNSGGGDNVGRDKIVR